MFTKHNRIKARKIHTCYECDCTINPSDEYVKIFHVPHEGAKKKDLTSVKVCSLCYDWYLAVWDYMDDNSIDDEFGFVAGHVEEWLCDHGLDHKTYSS